jgi:hypothetical protein
MHGNLIQCNNVFDALYNNSEVSKRYFSPNTFIYNFPTSQLFHDILDILVLLE